MRTLLKGFLLLRLISGNTDRCVAASGTDTIVADSTKASKARQKEDILDAGLDDSPVEGQVKTLIERDFLTRDQKGATVEVAIASRGGNSGFSVSVDAAGKKPQQYFVETKRESDIERMQFAQEHQKEWEILRSRYGFPFVDAIVRKQ